MRYVMLDTETTGLKIEEGHRIIEVGCIELNDRVHTDRQLHVYVNPDRDIEEGATAVHGITRDQLTDKPRFAEIAQGLVDFVRDSRVVIHNAAFDLAFLDAEFRQAGLEPFQSYVEDVIDSLALARELHPGQRNSLDALCQRYNINNEHRVLHGALLDARLLADVYLALTRGQDDLVGINDQDSMEGLPSIADIPRERLIVQRASPQEAKAHAAIMADIDRESGGKALWRE